MYGAVPSLLSASVRLSAFPDGSVDTFRRVYGPDGERLSTAAFRERLGDARSRELAVRTRVVAPGGQAVNAALQAHALGDAVRLDGFLDDERLSFPFETNSFGSPADVDVHEFTDGDLMYVEGDDAIADWRPAAFETVPDADAYVCANWATVDGMPDALRALAGDVDGVFVFDPGDVSGRSRPEARNCLDALGALDGRAAVAISCNGPELESLAAAAGVAAGPESVRDAAGVAAVVRHEREAATVATRDESGTVTVPNLETPEPVTHTGGGDRFSAGFAHGLAAGGTPGAAAALGNCCASYYVTTGETGTAAALRAFLADRTPE